ncbi:hypothetical protein VCHA53O466_140054 [Vibrio chagasii]|nr:hypothetical protein VCHA53O466_140054 [Vibrio chagasii]
MELVELLDTLQKSKSEKVIFTTARYGTFAISLVDTECDSFVELNALLPENETATAMTRTQLVDALTVAVTSFKPDTPVALWYEDDRNYIGQIKDYDGVIVIEHLVNRTA